MAEKQVSRGDILFVEKDGRTTQIKYIGSGKVGTTCIPTEINIREACDAIPTVLFDAKRTQSERHKNQCPGPCLHLPSYTNSEFNKQLQKMEEELNSKSLKKQNKKKGKILKCLFR